MKKTTAFLLFCLLSYVGFAQSNKSLDQLIEKLENYQTHHISEKVFLHLDRPSYSAGEDIWFKGYVTIAPENILSGWSKILYVDLIDPREKVVFNHVLPITAGIAFGDFALPDTLSEGSYRIRAYTRWMQNFSEDYFYDRVIQISNGRSDNTQLLTEVRKEEADAKTIHYDFTLQTQSGSPVANTRVQYRIREGEDEKKKGSVKSNEKGKISIPVKNITSGDIELVFPSIDGRQIRKYVKIKDIEKGYTLDFFPEGGYLLDQVEGRIAFKATDGNGKGVPVKITVKNDKDEEIVYVESNELGMGSFMATLSKEDTYSAHASFPEGTQEFSLPEISDEGVSMAINTFSSDRLIGKVNLSGKFMHAKEVLIVLQKDGVIFNLSKISPKNPEFIFRIDKTDIPSGVFQLSLLDENSNPMAERFIFHYNPSKNLDIHAKWDKESYSAREKVSIEIDAESAKMDSLPQASLSASVVHIPESQALENDEQGLLASMLLTSDVRGYIEKPGQYFKDLENIDLIGLDDLMLTQGWRKVTWEELDSPDTPTYDVENSLAISGTIHKLGRKATEPYAKVNLISTHNFMDFIDTTSNEEGRFSFDNLAFPDSIKFLISAKTQKDKNRLDIHMDETPVPSPSNYKNSPDEVYNVNHILRDDLASSIRHLRELENQGLKDKAIVIEEVVINRRREKKASEHSSNLNGAGNADYILTAEEMGMCPTLAICLTSVPGVIMQNGVPYSSRSMQGPPMQVVLDGMYMDSEDLSIIEPSDVESIEVLRTPHYLSIYGQHGAGGLLVITTKRGTDVRRNRKPIGLITHSPKGFYVTREFYKPDYGEEMEELNSSQKDYRKTIHWEPLLVTDEKGKATFDFYTSDEGGKYILQIKGMDLKGNMGEKTFSLDVK